MERPEKYISLAKVQATISRLLELPASDRVKVLAAISRLPVVEMPKERHGRWELHSATGFLRCDQCKDVYISAEWLSDGKWSHCPNCGARMDLPQITDETQEALDRMGAVAHGDYEAEYIPGLIEEE